MRPPAHHLRELAALVAVSHVAIVVLDILGRATFDGGNVLGLTADHPAWAAIHIACALLIAVTVTARRFEWLAMSASFWFLALWSMLDLVWRASIHPPVPLLGPVLGLLFACLALWLAHYWTEPNDHH